MIKNSLKIIISFITIAFLTSCGKQEAIEPFYLNDSLYGEAKFVEITTVELENLIKKQESFALFIYQPLCTTSSEFEQILIDFLNKNQMTFYKMSYSEMKKTSLSEHIKYYPSFAIYYEGELIDYLDAEKDEDTKCYRIADFFENWFTNYVKIKDSNNQSYIDTSKEETKKIDVVIENITYDPNKVNIYFFWGDGCPHCEAQFEFLESIKSEYGNYFNLYTFEVWGNEENKKILEQFASAMGDELKGIPYTIIGKETFNGFANSLKDDMKLAIRNQYKDSYDVYFDNK